MEKINLNTIASNYHATQAENARLRAVKLVEEKIIPELVASAERGEYSYPVNVRGENVFWTDVQQEIAERVACTFSGCGMQFRVFWTTK